MSKRVKVRHSPVHGRGLYANADLVEGEELLTYAGEVIPWDVAQERYDQADGEAGHTFYFDLGDGTVIDGGSGGNESRFINHGCDPNCEAVDDDGTIRVMVVRPVAKGEELFIDYRLSVDDDTDDEARAAYACRCGAANCRATMLSV